MIDSELLTILYQSLQSSFGLEVKCDNPDAMKRQLNAIRTKEIARGDTLFNQLKFRTSPLHPFEAVWIVKEPPK